MKGQSWILRTLTTISISIYQIDLILLPLLFINGLTLLLCTIQSYWIKEYNDKREITRDYKLIEKYVTNKT